MQIEGYVCEIIGDDSPSFFSSNFCLIFIFFSILEIYSFSALFNSLFCWLFMVLNDSKLYRLFFLVIPRKVVSFTLSKLLFFWWFLWDKFLYYRYLDTILLTQSEILLFLEALRKLYEFELSKDFYISTWFLL